MHAWIYTKISVCKSWVLHTMFDTWEKVEVPSVSRFSQS